MKHRYFTEMKFTCFCFHMTSSKYDFENYDQFAPNFYMVYDVFALDVSAVMLVYR